MLGLLYTAFEIAVAMLLFGIAINLIIKVPGLIWVVLAAVLLCFAH